MTTPVADHIVKARQSLKEARAVLTIDLAEAAGRAAYLAAYHAAQAFVLDRTGKTAKTHSGVRSEFARLAKDESRLDRSYSSFLARAYNLKSAADYAVGPDVGISPDDAREAIQRAELFVNGLAALLADKR
jgi:uncharacterized protein (UPF0332 family)